MVILRYCYGLSRRAAGMLPQWERQLLIDAGSRLLGIDGSSEQNEAATAAGLTADEYAAIIGPGS